jgi:2-oxo-4-hydroxy-4-carboxy-5-ureidoimidazoline decarboxylase
VWLLNDVNHGAADATAQHLAACNAAKRWIAEVLAQRSYDDIDQLLSAAERVARGLEWERRFGHVFLIRAADRSPDEMLAELRRRLDDDEPTERVEVTERLRLERMLCE